MNTILTFDTSTVLELALMAVLFAALLPSKGGLGWRAECKRGVLKAVCGCVLAIGAWASIQVIGQAMESRMAPGLSLPVVRMPMPPYAPGTGQKATAI